LRSMRFAHEAHVIPVMGSSACSRCSVALMACPLDGVVGLEGQATS
jgi:hypothetical protein